MKLLFFSVFQALTPDRKCFWLKADPQFEKIIGTKEEKEATVFTIKGKYKIQDLKSFQRMPFKSEHMKLIHVVWDQILGCYFGMKFWDEMGKKRTSCCRILFNELTQPFLSLNLP